jgi:hypothetical protein
MQDMGPLGRQTPGKRELAGLRRTSLTITPQHYDNADALLATLEAKRSSQALLAPTPAPIAHLPPLLQQGISEPPQFFWPNKW